MKKLSSDESQLGAESLMSETRRNILSLLIKGRRHISEIARETGKDRSTIAYHLDILENAGMVYSKYETIHPINSPGLIGNYFYVNKDVLKEAIEEATRKISFAGVD